MPLFEYRCTDCGAKFDELVAHADDRVECPQCHSANVAKLLSVFASATGGSPDAPACARPGCGATPGFS